MAIQGDAAAVLKELRNILKPTHILNINHPECLGGTRVGLREEILEWANSKNGSNTLLLLGPPGIGKSTIAVSIAREFQRMGNHSIYLSFLIGKSKLENVISSIAYGLAGRIPALASHIYSEVKDYEIKSDPFGKQFDILLQEPLRNAANDSLPTAPILIILDGLDECGISQTRRSLFNVLRGRLSTLSPNARFIVTGRPMGDIHTSMSMVEAPIYNLGLMSGQNQHDVLLYIRHELRALNGSYRIGALGGWEHVAHILAEKANGSFIWASTAARHILGSNQKYLPGRLEGLVKQRGVATLGELYDTILENTFNQDFNRSPLLCTDIDGFLGLDMGSTTSLLSKFQSLVIYVPGEPVTVHTTLHVYLLSCQGKEWYIGNVQKEQIAEECFKIMLQPSQTNICNLKSSFILNQNVPDLEQRIAMNIPIYKQYACLNWIYHLCDAPYSEDLAIKLESFAYKAMLYWFEVLSLTESFNEHVGFALVCARYWLRNKKNPTLSNFLQDALKQASMFSEAISESTLHIYTSMIPLTKHCSIFSSRYGMHSSPNVRIDCVGEIQPLACLKVICGHEDRVNSVCFSPDGVQIVSGSDDCSINIWDAASGERILGPIEGHTESVTSVDYSPKGTLIASGSQDGTIRICDAFSGELFCKPLDGHSGCVYTVKFSPDGSYLASGSEDGIVTLWRSCGDGFGMTPLGSHKQSVESVSFSYNGTELVSGSRDETIIVWDLQRGCIKYGPINLNGDSIVSVAFSPSGKIVTSTDEDVLVMNVLNNVIGKRSLPESQVGLLNVATCSSDGSYILAGYQNRSIQIWNGVDARGPPRQFRGHKDEVRSVCFAPDNRRFVSSSDDGVIMVWDVDGGSPSMEMLRVQGEITSISASPDGRVIASGSSDGTICAWDLADHNVIYGPVREHNTAIKSVDFRKCGESIVASIAEGVLVKLTNLRDGTSIQLRPNLSREAVAMAYSPNGMFIAVSAVECTFLVIEIHNTGFWNPQEFEGHENVVRALAYSKDGRYIVSGSEDKTVRTWSVSSRQTLHTFEGHSDTILSVSFSHDGSLIVSGSEDETIRLWDALNGGIVYEPIVGHTGDVNSVCFSPDDKYILSGSDDGTVRVWIAMTGLPAFSPFVGHTSPVTSVLFPHPESSKYLASGSLDGVVRIWIMRVPDWQINDDGWITSMGDELLVWLPNELREIALSSNNIALLNRRSYLRLQL